jgi:hypothetical protein
MAVRRPTKDYEAIAARKIIRPATHQRPRKFLFYSRNKKGKTTLGLSAGIDKVIVADPESGTAEMKVKNPHVWPIEVWEDLEDYYQFCRIAASKPEKYTYRYAMLDGATRIHNMALRFVMKTQEEKDLTRQPGFVQQRDYGKAGELMKELFVKFHNLNMGVIYTAQERQIENESGNDIDDDAEGVPSQYVPDLPKGVKSAINAYVDIIGRLYVVRVPGQDGKDKAERRLFIGVHEQFDTGYRSEYNLPDIIKNPTIPKLERMIETGKATTTVRRSATATKKGA